MQSCRNLIRKFNRGHRAVPAEQLRVIEEAIKSANSKERKMWYRHARARWRPGDIFVHTLGLLLK